MGAGLEKLCPVFQTRDVAAARAFYERIGFRAAYASPAGDYALLKRDGAELHLSASPAPAMQTAFMRPSDVNAFDAELAALGLPAEGRPSHQPAQDKPWGMREAVLTDPDGNVIRASQEIPDWPGRNGGETP
ncbi:MAG: VOC family protein [Pseudomonadota bacterium]